MARTRKITAYEMILNGGLVNFRRAVRHAARYGTACSALREELGRLPTLQEYWEFEGLSRAQAFREQQAWQRCVGKELSVLDVVSEDALAAKGFSEEQREDAIAAWLAKPS